MKSHELPPDAEGLSPEDAKAAINAVMADARGDSEHPLNRRDHPQHADLLGRVQRLQEAATPGPARAEPLSDHERAEIQERIKRIEHTPGFSDGSLRRENRTAHERLVAARVKLYESLHPEESADDGAEESEDADAEESEDDDPAGRVLREQAEQENAKLVALGFEPEKIPRDVQPYTVTALRMRRLNAEGNEVELQALMQKELKNLGLDADPALQADLRDDLIRGIYEANRRKHGGASEATDDDDEISGDDDA